MSTKQIIIIRRDLHMRRGKEVTQGAHSSMMFLLNGDSSAAIKEWLATGIRKICVQVNSLEELLDLHDKAKEAGVLSYLVLDSGKTEFNEPTYTCCAIGPDYDERIDPLTQHMKLY